MYMAVGREVERGVLMGDGKAMRNEKRAQNIVPLQFGGAEVVLPEENACFANGLS